MEFQNNADLASFWQILDDMMRERYQYSEQSYNLWFGRMQLRALDAERAVFVCENTTKQEIITKRYIDFIADCLTDLLGYKPAVTVSVDPSLAPVISGAPAPAQNPLPKPVTPMPVNLFDSADDDAPDYPDDPEYSDFPDSDTADNGDSFLRSLEARKADAAPDAQSFADAFTGVMSSYASAVSANPTQPQNAPEEAIPADSSREMTINPDYTFDNFIVGSSNNLAHAAALNVANNIGMKINPLFIYGSSGLGKTHLMYAIANQARQRNPGINIICIKGEEFTNQLVDAIRRGRNLEFRQKYRKVDMLLIDDIQFIAGKDATQTEFFHTFDALYEDHKQIILTSDRPPRELVTLEARIRSRFEQGLLVDIKPPDYELRLAILRNKVSQSRVDVPGDVVDFLAKNLHENIRQLEGVVKKLAVSNLLTGQPVNMEMVLQTVPEYLQDAEPVSDIIGRIISCSAKHFGVTEEDILGTSRKKNIQSARNAAMYVTRAVTDISLPQIGAAFARDHSTVHSNINRVEQEIAGDPLLEAKISEIMKEVKRNS
ncbi:MAG: chromosomal replication initiator protein DnaA [Clostridia bacterium]|nr:chromosomal replication initiator protein DnaA [Clostridia bacterium]